MDQVHAALRNVLGIDPAWRFRRLVGSGSRARRGGYGASEEGVEGEPADEEAETASVWLDNQSQSLAHYGVVDGETLVLQRKRVW